MANKNQEVRHLNAKQLAYEQKQAKKGDKIVTWIIISLLILAVFYIGWVYWMMEV